MIRITPPKKPRDRFGSIPIRQGKSQQILSQGAYLPRRPKKIFLWTWLKRIVILLLGATLILVIVSPLLIPYLATTLLAEQLSATLNRSVTIPRGEFNPLTCTLTLSHIIVGPDLSKPQDPVDPLLSAGKTTIAFQPKRLLDQEIASTLSIEHSFLHLVRQKDGNYNTGQTMAALLASMPVLPLRFSCKSVTFIDSRLVFDDELNGKTHLAEDISLSITPGAAAPDQWNPSRLQATINGIVITKNGPTGPSISSGQAPAPTEPGGDDNPGVPVDPAAKAAEAIALVQDLTQAARQYLQTSVNPPTTGRPQPLIAP